MDKRRSKYVWKITECNTKCGMKQLVTVKRRKERKRCRVHSRAKKQPDKWVRETAQQVETSLQTLQLQIQERFQEWPVGYRNGRKDFKAGFRMHVDLAYQVCDCLIGVEVHGGSEHKDDENTQRRDEDKSAAWKEEVAAQPDTAVPRCVGQILTIWAPEIVPKEHNGPLTTSAWRAWVNEQVQLHVRTHVLRDA